MFRVRIEEKGLRSMNARFNFLDKNATVIANPELKTLGRSLAKMIQDELRSNNFVWNQDPEGNLHVNSIDTVDVASNEVDVTENGKGRWIRYGYKGNPNAKRPPKRLVTWAESKVGLSGDDAYAFALAIKKKGTLSQSRKRYPGGWRGFGYPEYITEVKGAGEIDATAQKIGDLIVRRIVSEI